MILSSYPSDINECQTGNGGCSQQCMNQEGSFICQCNAGYTLASDGSTCNGKESSLNPGSCTESLLLIWSSYPSDINECQTGNGGCSQQCTNQEGSFICQCNAGYTLASDGSTCNGKESSLNPGSCTESLLLIWSSYPSDINECQTGNGGCSQQCMNQEGSFICRCNAGYTLASDGSTCNGK